MFGHAYECGLLLICMTAFVVRKLGGGVGRGGGSLGNSCEYISEGGPYPP